MTYGSLRLRLSKLAPNVDLELIDGWIQDRYTQILDQLPWKRLEGETVIQAPPSYQTGTLTATQGSNAIVGVGTTWTAQMTGLTIRIANAPEYYVFAFVDATHATLDRTFEQANLSGATYRIDQNIFLLPISCRIVRGVRSFHPGRRIDLISPGEMNRLAPGRLTYGLPRYAAATWDSNFNPPQMQIEFYPIPSSPSSTGETLSWPVDYIYDPADLDTFQTGFSMLPWTRPTALVNGVQADIAAHLKDYTGAEMYEAKFGSLVKQMSMINALQRGPQPVGLAPELRGGYGGSPGYHRGKHANLDYFDDYDA